MAVTPTRNPEQTTAPDGRGTPSSLLSRADHNLYAAKRGGRDRVVMDTPAAAG